MRNRSRSQLDPVQRAQRKVIGLLSLASGLLLLAGRLLAGPAGMLLALLPTLTLALAVCCFQERLVLWLAHARELPESEQPVFQHLARALAERFGLGQPELYLIEEPAPNAFAIGRDPRRASVVVTSGLLELLDEQELAAVLSHELEHLRVGDALVGGTVAILVFAITLPFQLVLALIGAGLELIRGYGAGHDDAGPLRQRLMIYLAPLVAPLLQLVLRRGREYEADAVATHLSGDPAALASALQKLELQIPLGPPLDADPAIYHLFIVNPCPEAGFTWLLSPRPSVERRLQRLQNLAEPYA